jgi:hypothetical protein
MFANSSIDKKELDRFWSKVDRKFDGGCWDWIGSCSHGYGNFWDSKQKRLVKAHRFSWKLFFGDYPENNLFVLHKCDNAKCVNPNHLFVGTQIDNMRDMAQKGRSMIRYGEKNPNAKLSLEEVKEIKSLYASGKYFQYEIAEMFNVSQSMVGCITRGVNWQYVDE